MASTSRTLGGTNEVGEDQILVVDNNLINSNPHEFNSFDDELPRNDSNRQDRDQDYQENELIPNETTSLLHSNSKRVKPKSTGRLISSREDPISFHSSSTNREEVEEGNEISLTPVRIHSRPVLLRLSFFTTCLLLYSNMILFILICLSINSIWISFNLLPPHFGSTFLPLWISFLAILVNGLTLLSFLFPNESPKLSSLTNYISALFTSIILILVLSVSQSRREESILTIALLVLSLITLIHSAASASLVERYSEVLVGPEPTIIPRSELGFTASLLRVLNLIISFITISLPVGILHIALTITYGLLLLNVIMRSWDASLEMEGQIWKVNPFGSKLDTVGGILSSPASSIKVEEIGWNNQGRSYGLHLVCRGIDLDPINTATTNTSLNTEGNSIRKTILVETKRGDPGVIGSEWILKLLREGDLTSADVDVRVCYYDRPGYGFSSNSPSSSIPHLVTSLTQALSKAGEFARLEPTAPSFALHRPQSGFILVGTNYGSLFTSLFAARHADFITGILYLNPLPANLHYSPRSFRSIESKLNYFFNSLLWKSIIKTELGFSRLSSVIFRGPEGSSRFTRRYSTQLEGLRGEIRRSFIQEEKEANNANSLSALTWGKIRTRYPRRKTVVLTSPSSSKSTLSGTSFTSTRRTLERERQGGFDLYEEDIWKEGTARFVEDVVGRGLVKWDKDWNGDEFGRETKEALLELVHEEERV